jgi:transcription elongation factor Elf1
MAKTLAQALNQLTTLSRCPGCGHAIHSTIAQLKRKPKFACPSCGGDCDVREAVIWAEAHARESWLKRVA